MNRIALLFSLFCTLSVQSQSIGLLSTLNVPLSARIAALGSRNVSLMNVSPAFFFQNPALASANTHSVRLSTSFVHHYADIYAAESALRYSFDPQHHFLVGLRYLSFGNMDRYDQLGHQIGTFGAGQSLFQTGYAYTFGLFSVGTSLKALWTYIDQQSDMALLSDLGAHYASPSQQVGIGLVIKNVTILNKNMPIQTQRPLDLWIGISAKTPHAPFRFSFTTYGWNQNNLYYDPNSPTLERHTKANSFFERLLSRFNFATEINLLNRLTLMGSWNYTLRRNNAIIDAAGGSGFAVGVNVHVWLLHIGLAQSYQQVRAGATSHISVALDWASASERKNQKHVKN